MNLEIMIQNQTTGQMVSYQNIEEALLDLEDFRTQQPKHSFEVVQLKTPTMDIPVTEDNLNALMACEDDQELELVIRFWSQVLGTSVTDSLVEAEEARRDYEIEVYYGTNWLNMMKDYLRKVFPTEQPFVSSIEDLNGRNPDHYLRELQYREMSNFHLLDSLGVIVLVLSYGCAFVRPKQQ